MDGIEARMTNIERKVTKSDNKFDFQNSKLNKVDEKLQKMEKLTVENSEKTMELIEKKSKETENRIAKNMLDTMTTEFNIFKENTANDFRAIIHEEIEKKMSDREAKTQKDKTNVEGEAMSHDPQVNLPGKPSS